MSFSITTLRGFTIKTFVSSGGSATLSTPVESNATPCQNCGDDISIGYTVTGPVGSVIKFKIGQYSDSFSVSCDDFDFVTVGNIAYLSDTASGDDVFSCLGRMPNGFTAKFIACNGSEYSEVLTIQGTPISCPSTIPAPTINIISAVNNGNGYSTLSYTVTSNYCHTTYFTDSDGTPYNYMNCGQSSPDPTSSVYRGFINGSGTTSSTYQLTCTSSTTYSIKAITYFNPSNQVPGCSSLNSSITLSQGSLP